MTTWPVRSHLAGTSQLLQLPTSCFTMEGSNELKHMPQSYIKRILDARVYDVARQSPIDEAALLSARLHNRVWLKREDLQPVFSFKLRGAYNKMHKSQRRGNAAKAWSRPRRETTPRDSPWPPSAWA